MEAPGPLLMSAAGAWPFLPSQLRRNRLEAAPPSPLPLFLSFFAGELLQQTAEGKEKPLPGSRPIARWELQNLRHLLTRMFFQAFQRMHPYPPSALTSPALISKGLGAGGIRPRICFVSACPFSPN